MTEPEYEEFRTRTLASYAADKARSGWFSPVEAKEIAEKSMADLLPQGPRTPGHHLLTAIEAESGARAGWIWFTAQGDGRHRRAFLYDILIEERFRGQGLGRAAMLAFEHEARGRGCARVGLHVFGHNLRAKALYDALGYEIDDWTMTKVL
jgi:ribosomal protein S18 acetylase RimI-like enzyme